MKYQSTRGGSTGSTFVEALFSGYAPDGGIFVPTTLPTFPPELFSKWKESPPTYPQVIYEIIKLFVSEDELPRDVLQKCIDSAYAEFDVKTVIGLKDCKGILNSQDFTVAEMFRGKTKSFKDYALGLVGRLMEYYVQKRKTHVTVLVATSGDTGSAAIEAVKGLQGIDIIVLFPKGKISEFQELQMVTVTEDNVHVFEVEGTSDDTDVPIKKCFEVPNPGLLSINSINWARIMIQISHHIYLCTLDHCQPVDIYVPTGGAGNLTAGVVASLLGFPINLFCCQNVNDNAEAFVNKGLLSYGGKVTETYSNAMDIRTPYNVERVLYFLSNLDSKIVANIMSQIESNPEGTQFEIPKSLHENVRKYIKGGLNTDDQTTLKVITECWKTNNYLICPHTATALSCFLSNQIKPSSNKAYLIATASPEKFPDTAKAAKIPETEEQKRFLNVLKKRERKEPKKMKKGEDWCKILQDEINLVRSRSS